MSRLDWTALRSFLHARDGFVRRSLRMLRFVPRIYLADLWRRAMRPRHVIAITGSGGKSTTTGLAALVLSIRHRTFVNLGYNTAPALAKRIRAARPRHRIWVAEVSGHKPGAIAEAARFLRHDIAVVTTIGSDHYKNFRSLDAVAEEKGTLVAMLPSDGLAVLNTDEPLIAAMAERTTARVVTFGRSAAADIRLIDAHSAFPDRLTVTISDNQTTMRIRTQLVGERWLAPVLAAVALGRALGIEPSECVRAVEAWPPYPGRDSVDEFPDGSAVIADTVKAPYWSLQSSVAIVRTARVPRKTMVIGTISDYAGTPRKRYEEVARSAIDAADRVLFVGKNSERVARIVDKHRGRLWVFERVEDVAEFLSRTAMAGELIYLKGSESDHLERIALNRREPIACWADACGIQAPCTSCRKLYRDGRRDRSVFSPEAMLANSGSGASRA